jgi:hypothetical protein
MKQLSVGHRCDYCRQEIGYLLPDAPAEAFGAFFQERTFLELSSAQIRDPSQVVAEYRFCSDYCAREALDLRIGHREKQMRQHAEADRLSLCFFSRSEQTGTATELSATCTSTLQPSRGDDTPQGMTKADLVDLIHERVGSPKKEAGEVVEMVFAKACVG